MPQIDQQILDQIQPVVLVGGRSLRFGRDKLIEPVDGSPMVASPINTLRRIFGSRVAIVGRCNDQIATLADEVIDDPYPGMGPAGGICAALEHACSDIFICAGDLISIDDQTIGAIINASTQDQSSLAFLAKSDRLHPTIGLYRSQCAPIFKDAIKQGKLKLGMVLDQQSICAVQVDPMAVRNINRPEDF
ncbi:MAG: molybdenum cofactor guanylyltransferase [Phycisphaerales bacterium]|nr:molybdenum cofactor guanylyltransferase [Phycisphaerales bacterium]